jgi:hypothetical protein
MKKLFSILMLMIIGLSGTAYAEDFQINKGWNLVSQSLEYDLEKRVGLNKLNSNSYFFEIYDKKYFQYNNIEEKNSYKTVIHDFFGDDDIYSIFVPMWFYSNEEFTISTEKNLDFVDNAMEDLKNDDSINFKLTKGWNLVTINGLMVENSFNEFKGTCGLINLYHFISEENKWETESFTDFNKNINMILPNNFNGKGFAVKVESDCEFDFSEEISAPPAIPSSTEETQLEQLTQEELTQYLLYDDEIPEDYIIGSQSLESSSILLESNPGKYKKEIFSNYEGSNVFKKALREDNSNHYVGIYLDEKKDREISITIMNIFNSEIKNGILEYGSTDLGSVLVLKDKNILIVFESGREFDDQFIEKYKSKFDFEILPESS